MKQVKKTQNILAVQTIGYAALSQFFQQPLDQAATTQGQLTDFFQQQLHIGQYGRRGHQPSGQIHAPEFPDERILPRVRNLAWQRNTQLNEFRRCFTAGNWAPLGTSGISGANAIRTDRGSVRHIGTIHDSRIVMDIHRMQGGGRVRQTGTIGHLAMVGDIGNVGVFAAIETLHNAGGIEVVRSLEDLRGLERHGTAVKLWFLGIIGRCKRQGRVRRRTPAGTLGIAQFLLLSPRGGLVVPAATFIGALSPMTLTTAEGATQIGPTAIPRMRQKADSAASAANHTLSQLWTSLQIAIQNQQILLDKRLGATALMPILPIRENFRNYDDKKAKFSAMILIVFCMTSLYLAEAKASRGKARSFSARGGIQAAALDRTPPARRTSPNHPSRPGRTDCLRGLSSP